MHKHTNSVEEGSHNFHTKTWYGVVFFCALGLGILGFISKDVSVRFYVMWAIILMCFAPEINMMMTAYMKANKLIEILKHENLKRKNAERNEKAASGE